MKRAKKSSDAARHKIESLKETLSELRSRKPFQPFLIVTKDGRQFPVVKPLWFGFGGDRLGVMPDGGLNHFMKFDEIDSVEVIGSKH
jgi:hypothetical protein